MLGELESFVVPRAPRYAVQFPVTVQRGLRRQQLLAKNASTTGLLVTDAVGLEVATELELRFRLADDMPEESLRAYVVRNERGTAALHFVRPRERLAMQLLDLGLEPEGI
jgi:hypothetical protein